VLSAILKLDLASLNFWFARDTPEMTADIKRELAGAVILRFVGRI
jgi:hypothetical protein